MGQKSELSETMPAAGQPLPKKADAEKTAGMLKKGKRLTIRALLRPHAAALTSSSIERVSPFFQKTNGHDSHGHCLFW